LAERQQLAAESPDLAQSARPTSDQPPGATGLWLCGRGGRWHQGTWPWRDDRPLCDYHHVWSGSTQTVAAVLGPWSARSRQYQWGLPHSAVDDSSLSRPTKMSMLYREDLRGCSSSWIERLRTRVVGSILPATQMDSRQKLRAFRLRFQSRKRSLQSIHPRGPMHGTTMTTAFP
jgi:hypothetical protein